MGGGVSARVSGHEGHPVTGKNPPKDNQPTQGKKPVQDKTRHESHRGISSNPAMSGDKLTLSTRAIEALVTSQDATIRYQHSDRLSLSARQIIDSRHQPELNGGTVGKADFALTDRTKVFAGFGNIPRYASPAAHSPAGSAMPPAMDMPGPGGEMPSGDGMAGAGGHGGHGAKQAGNSGHGKSHGGKGRVVGFVGVQDLRGTGRDLGAGLRLDATAHSAAMLAIASGHDGFDAAASRDLSAAFTSGGLTLSRQFGDFTIKGGYGAHLDLLKTYDFARGKEHAFPMVNYLHGGVEGKAGEAAFRLSGYVPLGHVPEHSGSHGLWVDPAPGKLPLPGSPEGVQGGPAHGPVATRGFGLTSHPLVRAEVGLPGRAYVPDLALVASTRGLERVELSKSWEIKDRWDVTVMVEKDVAHGGGHGGWSGGVGLRYSFGGRSKSGADARHAH